MTDDDLRNCEVVISEERGRHLIPCKTLPTLLANSYKGLGVNTTQLTNMKTMRPSREYWLIRSGEYRKNGIIMNYCPLCGADIRLLVSDEHAEIVERSAA